jgi:hypothetical protein
MANEYAGWQRYVHISGAESTWGTNPGSISTQLPIVGAYGVRLTPQSRQQTPMVGRRQRQHNIIYRAGVDGSFQPMMTAASMATLLGWCLNHTGIDLESRTIAFYDGVESKFHTGCRVDQATINWSAGNPVTLNLTIAGKDESVTTAITLSSTAIPHQYEAESQDVVVTVGGSELTNTSGSITIANNLQKDVYACKSSTANRRHLLPAGERVVDFTIMPFHNSATVDALLRTGGTNNSTVVVAITAPTTGGSTVTSTLTIAIGSLKDMSTDHDMNKLVMENRQYAILKPATTDNEIVLS